MSQFPSEEAYYSHIANLEAQLAVRQRAAKAVAAAPSPPRPSGPAPAADHFAKSREVATISYQAPPAAPPAVNVNTVPTVADLQAKLDALRKR
jgi:hypothetical protein